MPAGHRTELEHIFPESRTFFLNRNHAPGVFTMYYYLLCARLQTLLLFALFGQSTQQVCDMIEWETGGRRTVTGPYFVSVCR